MIAVLWAEILKYGAIALLALLGGAILAVVDRWGQRVDHQGKAVARWIRNWLAWLPGRVRREDRLRAGWRPKKGDHLGGAWRR